MSINIDLIQYLVLFLTKLKEVKQNAEATANLLGKQLVSNLAESVSPSFSNMLSQQQSTLTSLANSLGDEIKELERKLQLLQTFSSETNGLFATGLSDLELSFQAVTILNQTPLNKLYGFESEKDNIDASSIINISKNTLTYVSYGVTGNLSWKEAVASLSKSKNGTWWRSSVRSTKSGYKSWRQVSGDVSRFKSVRMLKI